ncbi:hypothetical protein SKAU_G00143450 [Synaphobranchus kaupii]|uniref:Uncharacterized protein n=1 Tax=Synaphobranchus kaupii TaxID=118154 RepID=A0A9Q1FT62_SYNKA|nr:hypothetical protein SKAU_G00143450 [Synaphobranchus kaupii]
MPVSGLALEGTKECFGVGAGCFVGLRCRYQCSFGGWKCHRPCGPSSVIGGQGPVDVFRPISRETDRSLRGVSQQTG